ncbi:MAG: DUF3291 domain-containing protein [Acidimicrobiia bacterium]|nr:DUF3291 domain-containing protein [Acidimicrobiia bacterium]
MHLAQLNLGRIRGPLEHPALQDFVNLLEPINALADESPGFVWRLQTDEGDATAIRVFGNDMLLVNLSVWEDVESFRTFVFGDEHRAALRRRAEWFAKMDPPHTVLWWIPEGHVPTVEEANERLALLRSRGATAQAFPLVRPYPEPSSQ